MTITEEPDEPPLVCYEGGAGGAGGKGGKGVVGGTGVVGGKGGEAYPQVTLTGTHAVARVAGAGSPVADFELWPTHSATGSHIYVLSIKPDTALSPDAAVCLHPLASTAFEIG